MMAQIVAKSLICLLIDEFNTKGNFLVVHKANLIFVTSEAFGIALFSIFSSVIELERVGRGQMGNTLQPHSIS